MARALVIVGLLILIVQSTGLRAGDCDDDCRDGQCPPICACCAHSVRAMTAAVAPTGLIPPPVARRAAPAEDAVPASPEPGDIFHVPKRPLA